jgi:hypothetical protein
MSLPGASVFPSAWSPSSTFLASSVQMVFGRKTEDRLLHEERPIVDRSGGSDPRGTQVPGGEGSFVRQILP